MEFPEILQSLLAVSNGIAVRISRRWLEDFVEDLGYGRDFIEKTLKCRLDEESEDFYICTLAEKRGDMIYINTLLLKILDEYLHEVDRIL